MQVEFSAPASKAGSRFAYVFLFLFGLPFLGFGLFALWQGVQRLGTKDSWIMIAFGAVFTLVGALVMLAPFLSSAIQRKTAQRQAAHPDEPWMWREDWANRTIRDSNRRSAIGMWFFATFWSAIAFPIAWIARADMTREKPMVFIVLLFPAIGVALLCVAIYQTLRSMKFGTSICHLERVPLVPGRMFRGDIEVKTDAAAADGYRLRLASIRAVTTRSGKNRSTTEHVLWDCETLVASGAIMRTPVGTRVPFQFATPPDSHPTDDRDSNDRYLWRLSATAQLPGVDYGAQFEIPVFQTGESVNGEEFAAFALRHRAEAARLPIRETSGVEVTRLPGGGCEYRIHPRKTFAGVAGSLLFLAMWTSAIAAMIHFGAPWGFPAVFIAFDILFVLATIDYFLGRSTVAVDTSGVRYLKQWSSLGSRQSSWSSDAIASIDGTTVGDKAFAITLKLRDGRTHVLGKHLRDRESADTVAARMMADLGERSAK